MSGEVVCGKYVFMEVLCVYGIDKIFGNLGMIESFLMDCFGEYFEIDYVLMLYELVVCGVVYYYV